MRSRFAELVVQPEESLDLALGALLIAQEEYLALDPSRYLHRLDAMAAEVGRRMGPGRDPDHAIGILNAYLFEELGFCGNTEDYYDPRNSFLNEVLDHRRGIPITISLVYIEVARRLALPVVGVGLPGHFIVKYLAPAQEILIDPFNRGAILSLEDCRHKVAEIYGEGATFQREYLAPVTKKQILSRMLHNLKAIYVRDKCYERALAATDRILLITPDALSEVRDRGMLYFRLQAYAKALVDLETYLAFAPKGPEADQLQQQIALLRRLVASLN
ncbi:MAG: tetratricopeptide repeat protein [Deltaproteobacteria bacterium]|nr:tetratricopeptide repeat protein [Deltaproteobacteria bacterium]